MGIGDGTHDGGFGAQGAARGLIILNKSQNGNPSCQLHQAEAVDAKRRAMQSSILADTFISGGTGSTDDIDLG
jgi:hypothetical protein